MSCASIVYVPAKSTSATSTELVWVFLFLNCKLNRFAVISVHVCVQSLGSDCCIYKMVYEILIIKLQLFSFAKCSFT